MGVGAGRYRHPVRDRASILHVDLDAFFASVEQRDKPSLRGRPVVVGGTGGRGVVATASYEARAFGVRSAMSTREARARCPHAAYLSGRFGAYREASEAVMTLLRACSPLVEPLSLDEAFVDLEAAEAPELRDLEVASVTAFAAHLRRRITEVTGGLTASVGIGSSKFIAKVASDLDKPDGLVVVEPGTERDLLRPLPVGVIPGVGPATRERLRRIGVRTVTDLERMSESELVGLLGQAQGRALHHLARAEDDRSVVAEREAKSVSVESTYEHDLTDRRQMEAILTRQAGDVAQRLGGHGLSGRTITIKVRLYDFTTLSRSLTLGAPTDDAGTLARSARSLLTDLDTSGGVRLLGVGVSGLADWVQDDLLDLLEPAPSTDPADPADVVDLAEPDDESDDPAGEPGPPAPSASTPPSDPTPSLPSTPFLPSMPSWPPGADVIHAEHGRGWVWGAGKGVVTVRFETAETAPGPVRSFAADDPDLTRWRPGEAGGQR